MKIFYIAGHGAGDSGATANGYQEQERVRALGKRLKALGGDNVMLSDFNRNYYRDNGISKLTIDRKTYAIVEGHMNYGPASARGANVHIYSGFNPDSYDKAIASGLAKVLPGRAESIVKRSDLANPKRAANKGYNYRLCEFGFISNTSDLAYFNSHMDDICKILMQAFNIPVVTSPSMVRAKNLMDGKLHVIQKSGSPTQYLTDGLTVKPITSQAEKQKILDYYKRTMGTDLETEVLSHAEFEAFMEIVE